MIQSISLGPLVIHLYGVILGIAVICAWEWGGRLARREKLDARWFERMAMGIVVSGIMGARLYHVVDYWGYYSRHGWEIVAVWQGGLGIWGAIIGGLMALLFVRGKRMIMLDIAALCVPLGQAIGRWGNLVNYELFGRPTTLPWGWWVAGERLHPLFLYESLLNILLFVGLNVWNSFRGGIGTGKFIGGYLLGYGLIRFSLEPLRMGNWHLAGMATASMVSLGAIFAGSLLLVRCRIKK